MKVSHNVFNIAIGIISKEAFVAVPAIVALLLLVIGVASFSAFKDRAAALIVFHILLSMALFCAHVSVVNSLSPHSAGFASGEVSDFMQSFGPFIGKY
jgi:uncharacterized membrane protein YoaK (UPF0700 family)